MQGLSVFSIGICKVDSFLDLTTPICYGYTLGTMEEDQKIQEETQVQEEIETQPAPSQNTSFAPPAPMKSQNSRGPVRAIVGILVLIVFIIAGFFIFKGTGTPEESPSPSPIIRGVTTEDETQTPTPTPEAVDKTKVTIEVQNGTGITGDAGYLRDILKNLGYEKFELGNASTQDYITTSVTYLKDLSKTVQDEITEKLKETYKEVDVKASSTGKVDVLIVTGLKKGSTPKAVSTPTPQATPTASPSSSPTATPSPIPPTSQ